MIHQHNEKDEEGDSVVTLSQIQPRKNEFCFDKNNVSLTWYRTTYLVSRLQTRWVSWWIGIHIHTTQFDTATPSRTTQVSNSSWRFMVLFVINCTNSHREEWCLVYIEWWMSDFLHPQESNLSWKQQGWSCQQKRTIPVKKSTHSYSVGTTNMCTNFRQKLKKHS